MARMIHIAQGRPGLEQLEATTEPITHTGSPKGRRVHADGVGPFFAIDLDFVAVGHVIAEFALFAELPPEYAGIEFIQVGQIGPLHVRFVPVARNRAGSWMAGVVDANILADAV